MPRCHLCNDFQRNARQFRFAFDCSQAELIQSANNGCLVCSFMLEGFRYFKTKLKKPKDHDRIYVWGGDVDGGGAVEMEIFSAGALELRLEFFVTKGKTSPLEGARMLPTIPGDTRAPASMDWAKQRLQQCVDSHTSCGQRSVPKLPTRVLEIFPGERDSPSVRVLSTDGLQAQYACLSHRWSKPAALVTKRSNVASHSKGIDWKAIPKTFKEAVLISQDLGLRYIWIDSLCIIQDDIDDMRRELARMSSIYTNSYITIAATHSEGETHGCYSSGSLYHRDHRLLSKQPDSSTVEMDLYVREKIAHIGEQGAKTPLLQRGWVYQERLLSPRVLHFCERELVWECQESSTCQCSCFDPPIRLKEKYAETFRHVNLFESNNSTVVVNNVSMSDVAHPIHETVIPEEARGVQGFPHNSTDACQETENAQAGATGIINTGNVATNTTCTINPVSESSACADSPTPSPPKTRRVRDRFLIFRRKENRAPPAAPPSVIVPSPYLPPRPSKPKPQYIPSQEVIWKWQHILSGYSGMDLTNQSDRLPAIAGVASQFGELFNSEYLAGLWQTALPGDLLWRTDYTIEPEQQRSQCRAPSWSWASVDGRIKHYACQLDSHHQGFSIVSAVCRPVSDINPFGEVKMGWLEVDALTAPLTFALDLAEDKALSRRRVKVEFQNHSAVFIPDYDISVGAAAIWRQSPISDLHKQTYHFLCVGDFHVKWNDSMVTHNGGSHDVSLVLQRVEEGRYERVGILERNPRSPKSNEPAYVAEWPTTAVEANKRKVPRGEEWKFFKHGWEFRRGLIII